MSTDVALNANEGLPAPLINSIDDEVDGKLKTQVDGKSKKYSSGAIKDQVELIGPDCPLNLVDAAHTPNDDVSFSPSNSQLSLENNPLEVFGDALDGGGKSTSGHGECVKIEEIEAILSQTIKEDNLNKIALFVGLLLTYTEEDQLNFMLIGPASTGKTYLIMQVLEFFPSEDKIILGYVSSKAFYHEGGYWETIDGKPLENLDEYASKRIQPWLEANPNPPKGSGLKEWNERLRAEKSRIKNEWTKIAKTKVQDYHQKILCFLDMPSTDLLSNLRPFLSHDQKRITSKITDRLTSGTNETMTVTFLGFPSVLYSTVSYAQDAQEQTRLIQLSPETSIKKHSDSISLTSRKLSNRDAYLKQLDADELRKKVVKLIQSIKSAGIRQIIIPSEVMAEVESKFREKCPTDKLKPEHQREYQRLIAYVKASALFNINSRIRSDDGNLKATIEDLQIGFNIYMPFLESNVSGLPPSIYKFLIDKLIPEIKKKSFLKRQEVAKLYFDYFKTNIGEKALKSLISLLLNAGYVVEDNHPENRSTKVITTSDVDMEALRKEAAERREMERAQNISKKLKQPLGAS